MEEIRETETDTHPFHRFKNAMRKLANVSKSDLDAELKRQEQNTTKQRPGPKPRRKKAD